MQFSLLGKSSTRYWNFQRDMKRSARSKASGASKGTDAFTKNKADTQRHKQQRPTDTGSREQLTFNLKENSVEN